MRKKKKEIVSYMKPNKKAISEVMSYLGSLNTPAQISARRKNMEKARLFRLEKIKKKKLDIVQ